MALQGKLEHSQKTLITQAMQQSLKFLQMSLPDLNGQLQELFMSNPFLEMDAADPSASPELLSKDIVYQDYNDWQGSSCQSGEAATYLAAKPQSYTDYLNEQLGQMRGLDERMLGICRYLVGCLSSSGYLDCPLDELAKGLGISLFHMEQALFVVQSLDPPGTGARSLSECLVLQLAQGSCFNELNLHAAQYGLSLISQKDFTRLAKLLNVSLEQAKSAAETIGRLNPIPAQGFYTHELTKHIIPELIISCDNEEPSCQYNTGTIPKLDINSYYCTLVGDEQYADAQPYLKEKLNEAKTVVSAVELRASTLSRLMNCIIQFQRDFFTCSGGLRPMTMQEIADKLELNVSTVSRAAKDKYVQFNGQLLSIRSLFISSVQTIDGSELSSSSVKHEISKLIGTEDTAHPLTDEALREILAGLGIIISRRAVAKYRDQLGIGPAHRRKTPAVK